MARTAKKTAKEVEQFAKQQGTHNTGDGVYLQVKGDARSWLHRYWFNKQERWSGLGSYPELTLAAARAKRDAERAQILAGIDPVAERKRLKSEQAPARAPTRPFRDVAGEYITNNESSWKNPVHRKQWSSSLEAYVYPAAVATMADGSAVTFGDLPVDEIATDHVYAVLKPIWFTKVETARRVRGRIEKVLGFAKALKLRSGENPARLDDNIALLFPKREKKNKRIRHHPALPYSEMPAFMAELRQIESTSAKALEFTILTAVRTGDIIGQKGRDEDRPPMKWTDVDLDGRLWTIPATKNDGGHRVPLSDAAVAVLKRVAGLDPVIVFPSPDRKDSPLSNNAMLALLDRMGHGDITVHGMRSTFRDWAAECTNFPRELAEKALAHTIGDETEQAYQRGDLLMKRRKLMEAWASYCSKAPVGDNVIELQAQRATA